ncbi:MAG TPA: phasin family protein [Candidatus Acidoferrum sp.]|nr:phasin family protein [Candidatus Acidoferrum sp.]
MANPRDDKSTQNIEDTARVASERATEQTARMGQVAAEAGDEVARAGAQLLQQNAETVQNAWRFGLDMATKVMGRSTEELGRTLGFSGNEAQQAQQATERSARNTETILYTSTAATRMMSGMSQEYFEFVRQQMEKSMERMNEMWRCRTPQDLAAVQSDVLRETVGSVLESSRKMADMSLKLADDATKHMQRVRPAA